MFWGRKILITSVMLSYLNSTFASTQLEPRTLGDDSLQIANIVYDQLRVLKHIKNKSLPAKERPILECIIATSSAMPNSPKSFKKLDALPDQDLMIRALQKFDSMLQQAVNNFIHHRNSSFFSSLNIMKR